MFLSVFGRSRSVHLFKYRAEIPLVSESGSLRNFQDAEILICQQLHHAGHPELIDLVAYTNIRQYFQFVVQGSAAHCHLRGDIVHIQVRIFQLVAY